MKIILAYCDNGYCGSDSEEIFFYKDNVNEKDIDEDVYYWALENAEAHSHHHFGWDEKYTDEEWEDYIENYVNSDWHEIDKEEYLKWCDNNYIDPIIFD